MVVLDNLDVTVRDEVEENVVRREPYGVVQWRQPGRVVHRAGSGGR